MKKGTNWSFAFTIFSLLLLTAGLVSAEQCVAMNPTPCPMSIEGKVTYTNGTAIPNGYYLLTKIGNSVIGECQIKNGFYTGEGRPCILQSSSTEGTVTFYISNKTIGQTPFKNMGLQVSLNFTVDSLPPRDLQTVSNGTCTLDECSYNLLDCDASKTTVCSGNGICDSNIGETCTNTPSDCGACSTPTTPAETPSSSGGGGGGGGGYIKPKNTTVLELSTNNTNTETSGSGSGTQSLNENGETTNKVKLTGLAIGNFVKTPVGKGTIVFVLLIAILGVLFAFNKNKKNYSKPIDIKIIKASDMKRK
jgi:hypothetical protein